MRCALSVLLIPAALMAQAPETAGDNAASAKRADIRKLLQAMHLGERLAREFKKGIESKKASDKDLPPEFWDECLKEVTPEHLIEAVIPAYEKNMTSHEVKVYLACVQTPEGAAIMNKAPQLEADYAQACGTWNGQMVLRVRHKLHAEGKM